MSVTEASRILLVEDEKDISAIIVTWLSKGPYIIDTAYDGRTGLEKIDSTNYDLLILDVMLPFIDGIEICRRVRAQGHKMPILILTAHGSTAVRAAALKNGADLLMTKPFKLRELSANLAALLQPQHMCIAAVASPVVTGITPLFNYFKKLTLRICL